MVSNVHAQSVRAHFSAVFGHLCGSHPHDAEIPAGGRHPGRAERAAWLGEGRTALGSSGGSRGGRVGCRSACLTLPAEPERIAGEGQGVQASDHRFGRMCLMRVTRRGERRALLLVRAQEPGPVGVRPAGPVARERPRLRPSDHRRVCGVVRDQPRALGGGIARREPARAPVAARRRPVPARLERRGARRHLRSLVDRAECVVAARRRAPHPVQHDVGAPARAGDSGTVRARPPGRDSIPWLVWPASLSARPPVSASRFR